METNQALKVLSENPTDESAWMALYLRFWPYALTIAFRLLGSERQMAEDVAQEAFLKVLQRRPTFITTEDAFRAYLGTTTRHIAIDTIRRTKREPTQLDEDPIAPPNELSSELGDALHVAFSLLRPIDQQILRLLLDGLPIHDIATMTNLTANNVGVHLHRIKKALRTQMAISSK